MSRIEAWAKTSLPPPARVLGISIDLGRTAFMTLDDHRSGISAERHRGSKEERLAQHDLFRLANVGNNRFERLLDAGRKTGERHRGAHQLQEIATRSTFGQHRGVTRELAMQHLFKAVGLGQFFQAPPVLWPAFGARKFRSHLSEFQFAGTDRLRLVRTLFIHRLVGSGKTTLVDLYSPCPANSAMTGAAAGNVLHRAHVVLLLQRDA